MSRSTIISDQWPSREGAFRAGQTKYCLPMGHSEYFFFFFSEIFFFFALLRIDPSPLIRQCLLKCSVECGPMFACLGVNFFVAALVEVCKVLPYFLWFGGRAYEGM